MFCSRCGRTLPPNSKTCPFCGSAVDNSRYCQFFDKDTHYDSSDEPETVCRSCGEILERGSLGGYCRECLKDPKIYQKAQERIALQNNTHRYSSHADHGRVKTTLPRLNSTSASSPKSPFLKKESFEKRIHSFGDSRKKSRSPKGCLITVIFILFFLPTVILILSNLVSSIGNSFSTPEPDWGEVSETYGVYEETPANSFSLEDEEVRRESVYSAAQTEVETELYYLYGDDCQLDSIDFDDSLYEEEYAYLWSGGTVEYTLGSYSYEDPFTVCVMLAEDSYYIIYCEIDGEVCYDLRDWIDYFGCATIDGSEALGIDIGEEVYDLNDPIYIHW